MKKTISLVLVLALGLTTEVANADFTFGTPTNLGPIVNGPYHEYDPSVSADGLSLYFISDAPERYGSWDIWVTTRATTDADWGTPVNLGPTFNRPGYNMNPDISCDDLSLYFTSDRTGGSGLVDLYVTRRASLSEAWGPPVNLGPTVNSSAHDFSPSISADELSLFFADSDWIGATPRPGGYGATDIWMTVRPTKDDAWGTPMNLGPIVNSSSVDGAPSISADGLALFFHSRPVGVSSLSDIWVTTRATTDGDWGTPVNLGSQVNSSVWDGNADISDDGSTLFFASRQPGGVGNTDLWQVSIEPVVDLNGDGIVDSADMCIMVDHWGTDEPSCDIGPMPWGDGIVDVQDLIVLAEHLFEDVNDPTLVAHWALDEIEGDIAPDSANDNDGTIYGDPAWQPEGGMVDGALQLDGIDDYVSTPFVLNPADGKFSIFVWIKGGAPGQAVLSQAGGANWLCIDPLEANLMTELKASGRGSAELLSQTIITDGNWHRIGLVWDGSHRTLYVDDVAVAEDEQTNLGGSENGLYIGTGTAMEPGSFWSGLIDDVRIYNRAVRP